MPKLNNEPGSATKSVISYIGIGSNLNNPIQQVKAALEKLSTIEQSLLVANSSFYKSTAIGPGEQPDYINAVAKLETSLSPSELLAALQAIESTQGRTRSSIRWQPRTLDLDILLFGNQIIDTENLTIPHAAMLERNFVLYPLQEIEPNLYLPSAQSIQELCTQCGNLGLEKIDS